METGALNKQLTISNKTIYIVVFGRVQGVGFRNFVREKARDLKLTGWVRNHPNQSVAIEAHGEKSLLETFVDFIQLGNGHSRIDNLQHSTVNNPHSYHSFEINY